MSTIVNLIAFFTSIFRVIGNGIKVKKAKNIVRKLENNANYRKSTLVEMDYIVGKKIDSDYLNFYNSIKQNVSNIQTENYQVKTLVDIDDNCFLIFVLCNDSRVEIESTFRKKLSNYIELMYFKVTKYPEESRVDVKSHFYNDNNDKYLMTKFYSEIEKCSLATK